METILHRIEQIAANEGVKITAFEKIIGASKGVLSRAINNGTDIQSKWLQSIVENYPLYSESWLLTGRGSMLKEKTSTPEVNYECKGAPYYNVDFIGGFDIVLNDQTRTPDYYINFEPYNKEGVIWCNITGHSMEPELNSGDFIAMKEMTDPIEYLPYGEVYGFITNSYRTIKRMGRSNKDGFIRLIPTNKNPEYSDQDIPVNMIRKVYAVLGSMHRLF
ncbi:S24 family peptidase [Parabacteroides goldsteinii]|jgi:hypothetical protein bfra3_13720|uniref:S24 family peptidase n=1 Tax=Parabacteroides goldsteinii TaxID=328812 RepID=UPI000E832C0F|nr:S24 family peptidase [Parabacteroides goldsteinii]DAP48868.1 MAG TPA: hypothetical protein [Caudoviricetes sp.]HBA29133.1 hypothetical protein [Parabacteroides goldsteinii]